MYRHQYLELSCLGVGDLECHSYGKDYCWTYRWKTISETIQNYQANIPEQELTAKKNICNKFAAQGYNPKDVIF